MNNAVSYTCDFNDEIKRNGSKCYDIDECKDGDKCGDNSKFVNLKGSFMCNCLKGFKMNDDG